MGKPGFPEGHRYARPVLSTVKEELRRSLRRLGAPRSGNDAPAPHRAPPGELDEAFLHRIYRELLDRPADPPGLAHWGRFLSDGGQRADVVLALATSDEYTNRLVRRHFVLPDLKGLRPDHFRVLPALTGGGEVAVYTAETPADFDWVENAILDNGYYDRPGIWGFSIDPDKQLMAEMLTAFGADRALDLGCANGPVMRCLYDLGAYAEGVEISQAAIRRAFPEIAERIHCGDLLAMDLEPYDLVYGLDIFEHFNPNRLGEYLTKLAALVRDDGFVYANVPAFGEDPQFGTVFDLFLETWVRDRADGRNFSMLQVDDDGYPMHGHLVWAATEWWQSRFEAVGFRREPEIERALHDTYDAALEQISLARKAYYVFSKQAPAAAVDSVVDRVRSRPAALLAGA